jgi:excisionase family DNA binding protein
MRLLRIFHLSIEDEHLRLAEGDDATMATLASVHPDETAVRTADAALGGVKRYLARHLDDQDVRLVVDDDQEDALVLPRGAVELLARILAHMAAGQAVSVVPSHAELTTQQAADLLNVSRPFLIGLLDAEEIEYRRVGKHRRVRADSLMDYKRKDDQRRRDVADELTGLSQEMGLH